MAAILMVCGCAVSPASYRDPTVPVQDRPLVAVVAAFDGRVQQKSRWMNGMFEHLGFDVDAPPTLRNAADRVTVHSGFPGVDRALAEGAVKALRERGYAPRLLVNAPSAGSVAVADFLAAARAEGAQSVLIVPYTLAVAWNVPLPESAGAGPSRDRVRAYRGAMALFTAALFDTEKQVRAWGYEKFILDGDDATEQYAVVVDEDIVDLAKERPLAREAAGRAAASLFNPPGVSGFTPPPQCVVAGSWPEPAPSPASAKAPLADLLPAGSAATSTADTSAAPSPAGAESRTANASGREKGKEERARKKGEARRYRQGQRDILERLLADANAKGDVKSAAQYRKMLEELER